MKILIFGMSNIGKTTLGRAFAKQIGYDFVDLDEEIIKKYTTINHFQTLYPNQRKRDAVRHKLIVDILDAHENVVVALSPIAYLDKYDDLFTDDNIFCFDLVDTPENIFKRLKFVDDDGKVLHVPQSYLDKHKSYYLREIRADMNYFHGMYKDKMTTFSLEDCSVEEAVDNIIMYFKDKKLCI